LPVKRVEIDRQGRDQRLAFTGAHFGDLAFMQNHAADQLDIEWRWPMRLSQLAATLFLTSVAFLPVHGHAADEADPVVATVAGVEIRASELALAEGDLDPQFARLPDEQRRVAALAAVIDIKTLARKAEAEALDETEEFKRLMAFQRDRALHNAIFNRPMWWIL
jgi:hypothetical protein